MQTITSPIRIVLGLLITFYHTAAFSQCDYLFNTSPAFEFNIPSGVTVTSVLVKINNYSHGGSHYTSTLRSFQDLDYQYFDKSGEYQMLISPITGPSTQDLQIVSGIDDFHGLVGDYVQFDWQVIITATGNSGSNINYSGEIGDNLAIPDNLGIVYNGTNLVSGTMNKKLEGSGYVVYPDEDYDGYGDANAAPILACSDYYFYSSNNLDCDDHNRSIHPEAKEILGNLRDDNCDGYIDCSPEDINLDASFSYSSSFLCLGDSIAVPQVNTEGGTFSSITGLAIDSFTGEINIEASPLGRHVVKHLITNPCGADSSEFEIEILPASDASFYYPKLRYCINDMNPEPVITGDYGGFYSATKGLSIHPGTGEINLSASQPGHHIITYELSSACPVTEEFEIDILEESKITNLVTSWVNKNGFSIQWDSLNNVSYYILTLSLDSSLHESVIHDTTTNAHQIFSNLAPETNYYISVRAKSECSSDTEQTIQITTSPDLRMKDSLALVSLYRSTAGDQWYNNENWLIGPLENWYGVQLAGEQVYSLNLEDNNLQGGLPTAINKLSNLSYFNFSDNNIESIPDSMFFVSGASGHFGNNRLTFEDIVDQPRYFAKLYDQQLIGKDTTIRLIEADAYTISLEIDNQVPDNLYVWFKDGVAFDTTQVNFYWFEDISLEEKGIYTCEIINERTEFSKSLTLHSSPITLQVVAELNDPFLSVDLPQVCSGQTVTLEAGGRHAKDTFHWKVKNLQGMAVDIPDSLTSLPIITLPLIEPDQYKVELLISNSLLGDTIINETITVVPLPEIVLAENIALKTDSLQLYAVSEADLQMTQYSFIWRAEGKILGTQNALDINTPGSYKVEVISVAGCSSFAETVVNDLRLQPQVIDFDSIADVIYGDAPFLISARSSSTLPVRLTIIQGNEAIDLNADTVSIKNAGIVKIQATQDGNQWYHAAEPVVRSFKIHQATQEIYFQPIDSIQQVLTSFTLEAISDAGLPVSYSVTGPVSIDKNEITCLDTGRVGVTVYQIGNENYLAANPVTQYFQVFQSPPLQLDSLYDLNIQIQELTDLKVPMQMNIYQRKDNRIVLVQQMDVTKTTVLFNGLEKGNYAIKLISNNQENLNTYLGDQLTLPEAQWISLFQDTSVWMTPIKFPQNNMNGVNVAGVFLEAEATGENGGRIKITKNKQEIGEPVAGLQVYLIEAQTQKIKGVSKTDETGKFKFEKVATGTYLIKADYKFLASDTSSTFQVNANSIDLIVLATDEIEIISAVEFTEQVTGIIAQQQDAIRLYPNPVESDLNIQIPSSLIGSQVEIFDVFGHCLLSQKASARTITYSFPEEHQSIYLLKITSQNSSYSYKILKK